MSNICNGQVKFHYIFSSHITIMGGRSYPHYCSLSKRAFILCFQHNLRGSSPLKIPTTLRFLKKITKFYLEKLLLLSLFCSFCCCCFFRSCSFCWKYENKSEQPRAFASATQLKTVSSGLFNSLFNFS